eukprot:1258753-Pyramimonas_sp.AAC.1
MTVLVARAWIVEHSSHESRQDCLSKVCSENISYRPQDSPRTFFGGPMGRTRRFATAGPSPADLRRGHQPRTPQPARRQAC